MEETKPTKIEKIKIGKNGRIDILYEGDVPNTEVDWLDSDEITIAHRKPHTGKGINADDPFGKLGVLSIIPNVYQDHDKKETE